MILYYEDGYWGVQSAKKKPIYMILWSKGLDQWFCTCPDYEYRRAGTKTPCKHIKMLMNFMDSSSMEKLEEVEKNGSIKI